MRNKKINLLIIILFTSLWPTVLTNAEEKKNDGGLGFSVSPVFNSNQLDSSSSIFYVQTKPGEEQTIDVKVQSAQKDPVKVKVRVLDAFTTIDQTIGYQEQSKIPKEPTMKNPVSNLITSKEMEFTVKNFEKKTIPFQIKAPKEQYEGVKIGAIDFLSDQDKKSGNMQMSGSAQIGVILAPNGEEFNNGKELKMNEVKPKLYKGKRMVTANLQNPDGYTLENLKINAVITEKKSGKKVKEREVTGAAMAPNSNSDFGMDWGLAQLPTGKFHYKMIVKNDFHEWEFEKDFDISGKQAADINDKSAYKILTPNWVKIVALIESVLLVLILISLVMRRKKMEKLLKSKRSKRKKNKKNKSRKGE